MAPLIAPGAFLPMPLLAAGFVLSLAAGPAVQAHGIETSLERVAGQLSSSPYQLESRFSTGVPASHAVVRIVSPDGTTSLDLGHTNTEGQLTFRMPAQARADWEVQVDAGPGHRDYLELPGAKPAHLHSRDTRHGPSAPWSHPLARTARSLGAVALLGAMAGLLLHRQPR